MPCNMVDLSDIVYGHVCACTYVHAYVYVFVCVHLSLSLCVCATESENMHVGPTMATNCIAHLYE